MENIPDEQALVKYQKGEVVKPPKDLKNGGDTTSEESTTIDGEVVEDVGDSDVTVTEVPIPDDLPFIIPRNAEVLDSPDDGESNSSLASDPSVIDGEILEGDVNNSNPDKPKKEVSASGREILKEEKLLNYLNKARQEGRYKENDVFDYVINGVEYDGRPDFLKTRKEWKEDFTIKGSGGVTGVYKSKFSASHALIERLANEAESRLLKKENLKNSSYLDDHFLSQLVEESEGTDREELLNKMIDDEPIPVLSKKKRIEMEVAKAKLEAENARVAKEAAEKMARDASTDPDSATDADRAAALLDSLNPASDEDLDSMFNAIDMAAGLVDFDDDVFHRIMTEANLDEEEQLLLRKQYRPYAYQVMSVEEKNKLAAAVSKVRRIANKIESEASEPEVEKTVETISFADLDVIMQDYFSENKNGAKVDFTTIPNGITVTVKTVKKFGAKEKDFVSFDLVNVEDDIVTINPKINKLIKSGPRKLIRELPLAIREGLESETDKKIISINVDNGLRVTYVEKDAEKGKAQKLKEATVRTAKRVGRGLAKGANVVGRGAVRAGKYAVKDSGEIVDRAGEMAGSLAGDIRDIPKTIRSYRERNRGESGMTNLNLRDDLVDSEIDEEDLDLPVVHTSERPIPDANMDDLLRRNESSAPDETVSDVAGSPDSAREVSKLVGRDAIIRDYLSYQDADIDPDAKGFGLGNAIKDPNTQRYAESLESLAMRRNIQTIENMARMLRLRMGIAAGRLDIPVSPFGESLSWAMWDMAKQNYFYEHPEEGDPRYEIGDPFSRPKQEEMIDRHLGWEAYLAYNTPGSDFNNRVKRDIHFGEAKKLLDKSPKSNGTLSSSDLAELGRLLRNIQDSPDQSNEAVVESTEEYDGELTSNDYKTASEEFTASDKYADWDMVNGRVAVEDMPITILCKKIGLESGDEVVFYIADRERKGTMGQRDNGEYFIRDSSGNPWGITSILVNHDGYIKKIKK